MIKKNSVSLLRSLCGFLLIIVVWQLGSYYSGWSQHVFPGPGTVLSGMAELVADGTLFKHTIASLFRVTAGFYMAVALGIPTGVVLGRWEFAKDFINPVIHFLRPISPLAWIPLAMLWFGIGDKPAVFLIFLSSYFPLAVSTTIAVESINPTYLHVASNFNFSKREVITRVVMPAIMPEVVNALRLSVTVAWLVVVAAEMIAVQSGLGYLILDSRNALRMDFVMVAMIVIGIVGLLLDLLMRRLGRMDETMWWVQNR